MEKEIPSIEPLMWDTACFQVKIGNVEISPCQAVTLSFIKQLEENAIKQSYRLLYLRLTDGRSIDPEIQLFFQGRLFHADKKINYTKNFRLADRFPRTAEQVKSYNNSFVTNELYTLAFESGHYSRFRQDPHFLPGKFEKMYRLWIERSVSGEIADDVLILEEKGVVRGMLTYRVRADRGQIGLLAVSPHIRQKGMGSLLVCEFERRMREKGIRTVEVDTQGMNRGACYFYEKQGFTVNKSINIYHLWL